MPGSSNITMADLECLINERAQLLLSLKIFGFYFLKSLLKNWNV
uniref:Uncharacterized protein n=1 Tax=Anguilla anguilla TaxID=7936 RepID=A0A0E9THM8_ANGAN